MLEAALRDEFSSGAGNEDFLAVGPVGDARREAARVPDEAPIMNRESPLKTEAARVRVDWPGLREAWSAAPVVQHQPGSQLPAASSHDGPGIRDALHAVHVMYGSVETGCG